MSISISSKHVPDLISSCRFEAQKLLMQVSMREMMLSLPLFFLPAITAFKTGYKSSSQYFHSVFFSSRECFTNLHMNCQVWKMDSSAMFALELILAVVSMTLTIGIHHIFCSVPKTSINLTCRWYWGQMCPRYNDKCVKVYICISFDCFVYTESGTPLIVISDRSDLIVNPIKKKNVTIYVLAGT